MIPLLKTIVDQSVAQMFVILMDLWLKLQPTGFSISNPWGSIQQQPRQGRWFGKELITGSCQEKDTHLNLEKVESATWRGATSSFSRRLW